MTTSSPTQPPTALFPRGMWADAQKAAEALRSADSVVIATHIDADGIAAAAIAEKALKRAGKQTEAVFHKKLDADAIASLVERDAGIVWFTDLGSGSISKIDGTLRAVVTDHHVPDTAVGHSTRKGQALLSDFGSVPHVNPHVHGISGANELSGAGATLMAALALDDANTDLAHLAVLGAVGDLQDQKTRRLEGLNRSVLSLAEREGLVSAVHDIRFFGRETRPIHKLLEFSSDPVLPRITGNPDGAFQFLREVGVEPRDGADWRTWAWRGSRGRCTCSSRNRAGHRSGTRRSSPRS
jgi:single-stranded-DNA-specific exonuclease